MQVADCSGTADAALCSAGRTKCVRPYTTAQTLRKTYIEAGCRLFRRCTRGALLRGRTKCFAPTQLRKPYVKLISKQGAGSLGAAHAALCSAGRTNASAPTQLRKPYVRLISKQVAGSLGAAHASLAPRGGRMRPPLHNPMLLLYGMGPQGFFEPWIELL